MAKTGRILRYTRITTPIGKVYIACTERGLWYLSLSARDDAGFLAELAGRRPMDWQVVRDDSLRARWEQALGGWFRGEPVDVPVDLKGRSAFARRVLGVVRRIPRGTVYTYAEVAKRAGCRGGARAVGRVMATNPIPLLIPCHRVIRSDGRLGDYSGGGPKMKQRLLSLEGVKVRTI